MARSTMSANCSVDLFDAKTPNVGAEPWVEQTMTDPFKRKTPAEDEEDWSVIWEAVTVVHQAAPTIRAIANRGV